MKANYLIATCLILIFSCQQDPTTVGLPKSIKAAQDTIGRNRTIEWVDTLYSGDRKIDAILRGKKNSRKYLDGKSETFYPSGRTKTVKFFYNDTAKGNFLEFYPNGKLQRFSYLVDNIHSVYTREYDSIGGLIQEKGTPLVGYKITEKGTRDTAHVQAFLSDFGFVNLDMFVSPDGEKYVKMASKDGEIVGTKVFKMWKPIKGLSHISFYMKIIASDSSLKQHVYVDTLSFKR